MPAKLAKPFGVARWFAQGSGAAKRFLTYWPVDETARAGLATASPMPRLRSVAWTGNLLIAIFIGGFGIWSIFAPLKSAAVASGIVEPESGRKTIQHLEGGIVQQIRVKNGDKVTSGQVLIALDDTKSRSERDSIQGQLWDAEARQARMIAEQERSDEINYPQDLKALIHSNSSIRSIMIGQQRIFQTRRQVMQAEVEVSQQKISEVEQEIIGLTAQKTALAARAEISRQQLESSSALAAKGAERKTRLFDLGREKADLDGQIGETQAQIARAYQVINETQAALVKLQSDRMNEVAEGLRDTESQVLQLGERLRAIDDQLARTEIRAPEDGVIMDLRIHTIGGVIGAGEPLVDLVPREGRLVVSAHVRPEDIHLVHAGLEAQVHLLPYNQRRVPLLRGEVEYVSADRLVDKQNGQPYYQATIRVTDERLAKMTDVELVPGMPAQALIETGKSSVAFYAVRPLLDSFHRAFRED
ncbi:HlyD family type I secretion periplasmic adaptor subunit [Rhizobium tubonense]|uniref:Membrane fusion protein (MFP) family protein n=1 Tax=Rhizobium tubonense TaxID=484088 RepID=A0A2W4CKU0_9HYPH|nr:HlyD family type I secretion periplasmic adaptor subunit [Rhizobium tubonense]PZM13201.1 hemolysin secretion protein D [Rhizobium tubonense]